MILLGQRLEYYYLFVVLKMRLHRRTGDVLSAMIVPIGKKVQCLREFRSDPNFVDHLTQQSGREHPQLMVDSRCHHAPNLDQKSQPQTQIDVPDKSPLPGSDGGRAGNTKTIQLLNCTYNLIYELLIKMINCTYNYHRSFIFVSFYDLVEWMRELATFIPAVEGSYTAEASCIFSGNNFLNVATDPHVGDI